MATVYTRLSNVLTLGNKLFSASNIPAHRHQILRHIKRYQAPYLFELYRRKKLYPTPVFPKSAYVEWNRKTELYAFGARVSENFDENLLNVALTNQSYNEMEQEKRLSLGIKDNESVTLEDNNKYSEQGEVAMNRCIKALLRYSLPYLPEEGICAISNYLISDEILSFIASNLGLKDIILCKEYPPEKTSLAQTFKAIFGLLSLTNTSEHIENFIRDFVLTQLIDKDINDLWEILNPMGLLTEIMQRDRIFDIQPRLLREAGSNTIFSVYVIGLYVDKKLIGTGTGETLATAEEMAARDALKRLFRTQDSRTPFPYAGHPELLTYERMNLSVHEWSSENAEMVNKGKTLQKSELLN